MRKWYEYGDRLYEKVQRQIRYIFSKSRLTLRFDEINQMGGTKKMLAESKRIYKVLDRNNRKCFEDLLEYVYVAAWEDAGGRGKPKPPGRKWLDEFLNGYDPVTKYVYTHEVERKRARFFEAIIADVESGNRLAVETDYLKAERYWLQMGLQYMIDLEDATAMQAYRDAGVQRVKWVTMHDERVCHDCDELDGKIFPIDQAPGKLHWRCRCRYVPVKNGGRDVES